MLEHIGEALSRSANIIIVSMWCSFASDTTAASLLDNGKYSALGQKASNI
jgi:hypothetical protein